MRLRNIPGAKEAIVENKYAVKDPEQHKGHWNEVFENNHPIHIEVGCGKGAFITGMAALHPEINYIAIDMQLSVLSYALDKAIEADAKKEKLFKKAKESGDNEVLELMKRYG